LTAKIFDFYKYFKGDIMRCLACNVILTEEEQQRKFTSAGDKGNPESQYVMLCNSCLGVGTEDDLSEDLGIIIEEDTDEE
jgi:hypothetical protein